MKAALCSCRGVGAMLAAGLLIGLLAPAGAEAKVYFSAFAAEGGTAIERAGFDGSALETLQFQPTGFDDGLAIDASDGRMYWTDTNASVIWSADLSGADAGIVLDDFGGEPVGIALDPPAGRMYFTDREGVKRASLSGIEPELLVKGPARGFIALDQQTQTMYWADWPSGSVKAAAMAPEATVTLIASKQPAPFGVALDEAAGKLYWLQLDFNKRKTEQNAIRRANLDGSEAETLLERPGADFEGGIALDPSAGKLYWSEAGTHDVAVANLDGTNPEVLFSTGEDSPEGLAIEPADLRPVNTSPPAIEGTAQVGQTLFCNPGGWRGNGSVALAYQWEIAGEGPLAGATGATYVPSAGQAGEAVSCLVTATDSVDSAGASSAAVTIAPFPTSLSAQGPAAATSLPRLAAGFAFGALRGSAGRTRVPVFASLACTATLTATPLAPARHKHTGRGGAPSPARPRAHAARSAPRRDRGRARRRAVTVTRMLAPGRSTITLTGLARGAYRLSLTAVAAGGQVAHDRATLKVR